MAKKATETNKIDPKIVKPIVNQINSLYDNIDSERGTFMQRCRSIRDDIANKYEEAKARGISKKALKVYVDAQRKIEAAKRPLNDLESDDRETVEMIAEAMGEAASLPLFKYPIDKAAAREAAREAAGTTPH